MGALVPGAQRMLPDAFSIIIVVAGRMSDDAL
jgi:hypothetical protein